MIGSHRQLQHTSCTLTEGGLYCQSRARDTLGFERCSCHAGNFSVPQYELAATFRLVTSCVRVYCRIRALMRSRSPPALQRRSTGALQPHHRPASQCPQRWLLPGFRPAAARPAATRTCRTGISTGNSRLWRRRDSHLCLLRSRSPVICGQRSRPRAPRTERRHRLGHRAQREATSAGLQRQSMLRRLRFAAGCSLRLMPSPAPRCGRKHHLTIARSAAGPWWRRGAPTLGTQ